MTKVAFIGAGSIEFTRNVVTDLCGFTALHGQPDLILRAIDEERLEYAEALVRRINEQTGAGARVGSSCGLTRNKAARECVRA
jgi:alpha-galactosidase